MLNKWLQNKNKPNPSKISPKTTRHKAVLEV